MKRILIISVVVVSAIIGVIVLGGLLTHYRNTVVPIHDFLESHILQFAIWRYLLLFLIAYFWSQIIKCLGKLKKWHPRIIIKLIRFRWKFVGFFVLFEIIFVYNLFGKTIGFIMKVF